MSNVRSRPVNILGLGEKPFIFPLGLQATLPAALGSIDIITARFDFVGDVLGWLTTFPSLDGSVVIDNFDIRRGKTVASGVVDQGAVEPGGEIVEVFLTGAAAYNIDLSAGMTPGIAQVYPGYFAVFKLRRILGVAAPSTGMGLLRLARRQTSL